MAVLIDNKNRGRKIDTLSASIKPKARISILSSNFSIFAYKTLRKQLEKAESIRLLFQKNTLSASELLGGDQERRFRNSLEQTRIAKDCRAWLDKKAAIKVTTMPTPQNLIIVQNEVGDSFAITGSSPFTSVGLGLLPSNGYEMNTLLQEEDELHSLLDWFDSLWNDPGVSYSDNSALTAELQEIARDRSPEELYYTTLFHMFHDSLEEIEEEKIIKSRTGIRDTSIWEMLYKFQKDAVLGAIHKSENYTKRGCGYGVVAVVLQANYHSYTAAYLDSVSLCIGLFRILSFLRVPTKLRSVSVPRINASPRLKGMWSLRKKSGFRIGLI